MPNERNPQLEAAFREWLSGQDDQLREAIFLEQTRTSAFTLQKGAIELKGSIERRGIDIFAERNGRCWDILLSLVVVPEEVEGGYHCLACLDGERRVFDDIDELWRNHLFGPLKGWMRRKFLRADRLCFYSAPRATWVRLLRPTDDARETDGIVATQHD